MLSLRQSLAKIGKQPPIRIPTDFQTCPKSLGEIVRILNLPKRDIDTLQHNCVHSFTEENAQGLVYAHDEVWFLSSQDNIFKYAIEGLDPYNPTDVRRLLKVNRDELVKAAGLDKNNYRHIGDLSYLNSVLIAPLKHKDNLHVLLLALNEDLCLIGYAFLPKGISDAWCAFNPWNRLLYMSNEGKSEYLSAFDTSEFFQLLAHPDQYGSCVNIAFLEDRNLALYDKNGNPDQIESVQGSVFSGNGQIYVTWCVGHDSTYDNYLRVYNMLTGMRLGEKEYDFEGSMDEIEGISVHPSGVIYIAVCDNDWPTTDEFEIHAFKYADPI